MAACTKPPRMCIVMELMALGSLVRHTHTHQGHDHSELCPSCTYVHQTNAYHQFDLIHNDLIPDIPMGERLPPLYLIDCSDHT
jgi:hypothetical protein